MIDLLIEEVAVTMAVGAPDRNGARRRSTFAVQFVQGIQEAIEFLLEQLQLGLHQATPRSGDVLPLSAEKRPLVDPLAATGVVRTVYCVLCNVVDCVLRTASGLRHQ